ncbi:MAG: GNAT family N-acetyltransferase [Candidatus Saccharimonas sp.]|nr:MAG: GNAT family N-acetyltransferase [Candidatus Saccharimonas sp.]
MNKIENDEWSFCFLHELGMDQQGEISVWLSNLTYQDDTVLNMSPDDIMEKSCVALLFDEETGEVIASASMMQPQINSFGQRLGEIGSMFTIEGYQRQGAASFLVQQIDEWAKAQDDIHGAYAFLNSKSPRSFAVNGYSGEIEKDGKILNAAEIVPAYAFNLCRTICRDEKAMHLMDLELRKKALEERAEMESSEELIQIRDELDYAKFERWIRFEKLIYENKTKIYRLSYSKDLNAKQDIETHRKIIDFYHDNLKNNLHCCDVVVAKLF